MWHKLKTWLGGNPGSPQNSPAGDRTPEPSGASQEAEKLRQAYADLGLEEGTDLNTVRRVWKAKLKEFHMDHYADDPETQRRAHDATHRLNTAYNTIRDALF